MVLGPMAILPSDQVHMALIARNALLVGAPGLWGMLLGRSGFREGTQQQLRSPRTRPPWWIWRVVAGIPRSSFSESQAARMSRGSSPAEYRSMPMSI